MSRQPRSKANYESKIARSRYLMLFERVWPRLWLPFGVICIFMIASAAGLWGSLPRWFHISLLGLSSLAVLLSFIPVLRLSRPSREQAIRWLEKKSGLPHRPISTLEDQLPEHTAQSSRSIWRAHAQRINDHVKAMRPGLPHPNTSRFDPYALRIPVLASLICTAVFFPHQLQTGLVQAFTFDNRAALLDLRIDAWVTPPGYTNTPPILLVDGSKPVNDQEARAITVPEASELIVRLSGKSAPDAQLTLRPANTDTSDKPEIEAGKKVKITKDGGVREMRTKLSNSAQAVLELDGRQSANWHFNITPDHPPTISLMVGSPQKTPRNALRLSYRIADDFGIAEATAHIRQIVAREKDSKKGPVFLPPPSSPREDDLQRPLGEPPVFSLILPKGNARKGTARTYKDLTAHPWAGLEVELVLVAKDIADKTGETPPKRFTLPERAFTKPLAKAIIKIRRRLVAHPYERRNIAALLDALTDQSRVKISDKGVFLGLRSAYWRLTEAAGRTTISTVVDQLWDIALTIEDGNLSKAERDLRAAQDRLMDALNRNASAEEIEQLMKELRTALNEFMKAMAQNQQRQNNSDQQQQAGNQKTITSKQLDQMLKNIENMAKTGSRDSARQMLSQLREMLEGLKNGQPQQSAGNQEMRKSLDELGKMIMEQRRLLDQTHRQNQQQGNRQGQRQGQQRQGQQQQGQQQQGRGQQGQSRQQGERQGQQQGQQGQMPGRQQGSGQQQGRGRQAGQGAGDQQSAQSLQRRQGELLDGLNGLIDKLGRQGAQIPRGLMQAGSNMGQAERRLGQGRMKSAGNQQGQALDNLRKGAQSLAEQIMRRQQGPQGQAGRNNRDPLGRPQRTNGPEFGEDVNVPDEINTQRARNILEELRRRLGQSTRPPQELDYLERLIEQF